MKKLFVSAILIVFVVSCQLNGHGNFNKRKYLNLGALNPPKESPIQAEKEVKREFRETSVSGDFSETPASDQPGDVPNYDASSVSVVENEETIERHRSEKNQTETQKNLSKKIQRTANKSARDSGHINGLYFFLILAPLLLFARKDHENNRIGKWARRNPRKAQVLITAIASTGVGTSYLLGRILNANISAEMLFVPLGLVGISLTYSALKRRGSRRRLRDRVSSSLMNVSIFFTGFIAGSGEEQLAPDEVIMHPVLVGVLTCLLILALVGACVLLYALSCELVCSGAAAAAAVVLVAGGYLIFFLFFLGLYEVYRKQGQEDERFAGKAAALGLLGILVGLVMFLQLLSEFG